MNKNATAQLHVYSAFFVLAGFVLNRGVFLLFLAEKGMSVTEIALYQALFNIATVVLELPTGLVGDFFGKKFSIQVGVLLLFFHTAGMLLLSGPFLVAFREKKYHARLDANRGWPFHDSSVVRFKSAVFVWP